MALGAAGVILAANSSESSRAAITDKLGISGWFAPGNSDVLTHKVRRTDLAITVKEKGELESANNLEAKCEVEGSTTIISILPEGTRVEKDQLVCELDDASLVDQLANQKIATERAKADYDNAIKTFEVAEINVQEYIDGIFPQELKTVQGEIKLAESELTRAKDRLEWSNDMVKLGYITPAQNQADKLELQKAEFNLQQAEQKKDVLINYTKPKQIKSLEGEVEKARADMLARKSTYELETEKEQKLQRMIENCKIYAPGNGIIVYHNERDRWGSQDGPQIEEGAQVRERQVIFKLPDVDNMQVNTKVHESMVDKVKAGLSCRIRVDAFPKVMLDGTVLSVAPLPDPTSFFSSDVKVYTTVVSIDDNRGLDLRPGMTAEVEILISRLDDVLSVPVQSVIEYGGGHHVWVAAEEGKWQRREASLGMTNSRYVEITEGLEDGAVVTLDPRAVMTEEERQAAFGSGDDSKKGDGEEGKEWSDDDAKKADAAKDQPSPTEAAKKKGGAGGNGAMRAIFSKLSAEDRAKLFNPETSEEQRTQILKGAGATDAMIQQMQQMRQQFGGGGPGGPGGGRPGGGGPGQ